MHMKLLLPGTLFFFLLCTHTMDGQTTLIDPNGAGGFENGADFSSNGWSVVNGSNTTRVWQVGTGQSGYSGARAAFIGDGPATVGSTAASRVVHFYRSVTFPAGSSNITLTFKYKQAVLDATYDYLKVYLNNNTPVSGTLQSTGQIGVEYPGTSAFSTFTEVSISIPNSNAGTTKNLIFTFAADAVTPHAYGAIDDISLTYTNCNAPTSPIVSGITANGANLSWTAPSPAPTNGYEWAVTTSITPPASGTATTSTSAVVASLSGQTTYYLHVRSNCGASGNSGWVTSASFVTSVDCAASTVLSCGVAVTSGNLATTPSLYNPPSTTCGYSTPGKERVYAFTATNSGNHTLNITGVNGGSGFIDYFYKDASGGCGATGWTCIGDKSITGTTTFGPLTNGVTYYLLLDAESSSGTANHTFKIDCPPACSAPTALSTTNITGTTADLSWTAPSPAPSNGYEWAVTTSSTPPASGTAAPGTTASASGLSAQTTYYLHVRSNCGANGFSSWATSAAFSTLIDCAAAISLSCGTAVTSGNLATSGSTMNLTTCGFSTPGKEKLYTFTPTISGTHTLNITGVNGGTGYIEYFYKAASGGCGAIGWTCIDDNNAVGTDNFGPLTAGVAYFILLDAEDASGVTANHTFKVDCPPACSAPTGLSVTNITGTTADVSWTAPASAPSGGYEWAVTTSSTPPASGTAVTGTTAAASGLSGQTTYYLHVRSNCDANGFSAWATSASFFTLLDCAAAVALTCGSSQTSGNLATAGSTMNLAGCGFSTLGKEKLYTFTPTLTGNYTLNITNLNGGTGFIDYFYKDASGGCGVTGWTCIDDNSTVGTDVFGPLTANTTYYILLDAESASSTANHTFQIDCPTPMNYVSSTVAQVATTPLNAGSTGNAILRMEVVVNGTASPLTLTQLDLNTNGSTSPGTDISAAKVYFTGTSSTFSTTTQYGSTVNNPNGAFTVSGSQALTGGASNTTNYFWLVFDLQCAATASNIIDAQCTGLTLGSSQTPSVTDPAGNQIVAPLYSPTYTTVGVSSASQGSTANQIVRMNVSGSSLCSGTVGSITFNTANSTSPATDIKNARCYYTTTTAFSTSIVFGSALANPSGDMTFSGSQLLASGSGNYFWLVYDLECTASTSSVLNGTAVNMVVNGNTFSATGTLPATKTITGLSSATTAAAGNWSSAGTWGSGCVPNNESAVITLAHDVTVDGMFSAGNITINSGRSLILNSGGTLTMGPPGGGNRSLTVNGTLNMAGGTLNLNGSASFNSTSVFNMSSGTLNIDPNDGNSATSAAATSLNFQSASINVTGGAINLLDPPFSSTYYAVSYSVTSTDAVLGAGCTVTVGGGTHQNSANTNGFMLDGNVGTGTLEFGALVINGGRYSARRHASTYTGTADNLKVRNLTVNSGAELVVQSSVLGIVGSVLQNDGFITVTSTTANRGIAFCGDVQYNSGVIFTNSTAAQQIAGAGYFKKALADPDPSSNNDNIVNSLAVFHNQGSGGLSLSAPLAVVNLDLGSGMINTSVSAPLIIGNGPAASANTGTVFTGGASGSPVSVTLPLTAAWTGGWVNGPLRRWFTGVTSGQQALLPTGSSIAPQLATISFTSAPTTAGMLEAAFIASAPLGGTVLNPALTQSGIANPITTLSPSGYWDLQPTAANGVSGTTLTYTAIYYANSFTKQDGSTVVSSSEYPNLVLLKRPSNSTLSEDWALNGTHVTAAQAGTWTGVVRLSRSGMTNFSHFAMGGTSIALPLQLLSFSGKTASDKNILHWKTAMERHVAYHQIERSADAYQWSPLGQVASPGDSDTPLEYSFEDAQPLLEAYYRLRSVDHDGSESLSPAIFLARSVEGIRLQQVFPSPTSGPLTLLLYSASDARLQLTVVGMDGRIQQQSELEMPQGTLQHTLDLGRLPAGMYQVRVTDGRNHSTPVLVVKE
jgi:hypothetical protein